jgi:FtsH-binding integral membrane protein
MILAGGHALNQPAVPFPRREAAVLLALVVAAAYTTAPFAKSRLTKSDKFACVGILACGVVMFVAIFLSVSRWEKPLGISLLVCLGVIWAGRISRAHA